MVRFVVVTVFWFDKKTSVSEDGFQREGEGGLGTSSNGQTFNYLTAFYFLICGSPYPHREIGYSRSETALKGISLCARACCLAAEIHTVMYKNLLVVLQLLIVLRTATYITEVIF